MRALTYMILLVAAAAGPARAQISPGELARAHESLEGMTNCLKCHELGAGPSAEKCLACHGEISAAIEARSGYHYRVVGLGQQACFDCHSDHAGRAFELIHWPDGRERFDHSQAGWKLGGAHAQRKCRDCHVASRIDPGFAAAHPGVSTERTFLGLDDACLSCHADPHAGQFSRDCAECHGDTKWKPADRFDHARTAFPLHGRHAALDCTRCHTAGDVNGASAIRYAAIPSDNCGRCHTDPHKGRFGADCASCHGEDAWKPVTTFDHARTTFPLTGRHAQVACEKCHKTPADSEANATRFARFAGLAHDNCTSCHTDRHEGRLGVDCASCHNTGGWNAVKTAGGAFDHGRTRYPLVGLHARVACEKCHTSASKTAGLEFDTCDKCHRDTHQGQFAGRPDGADCARCHDENGFVPARFTVADHARSRFALAGAHLAQPCVVCHREETMASGAVTRRFVFDDVRCQACHQDAHAGQFTASAPVKACSDCHGVDAWPALTFDHDRDSAYRLDGQHRRVLCAGCHTPATIAGQTVVRYRAVPTACAACHTDQPVPSGGSS